MRNLEAKEPALGVLTPARDLLILPLLALIAILATLALLGLLTLLTLLPETELGKDAKVEPIFGRWQAPLSLH